MQRYRKKTATLVIFLVSLWLSACSGVQLSSSGEAERFSRSPAAEEDYPEYTSNEFPDLNKIVVNDTKGSQETLEEAGGSAALSSDINKRIASWIEFFTVRDRERTVRFFERGLPLRAHMERILKENEVPPEIFYLAMIESGFVMHAKSRARAVGAWQFMRGTAKNYGLIVNNQQDERRNWIKATEAAASYLKDLNNVFGSWYLALAAYNAGEHRIVNSIMRGKTRDFWALAEAGMLPRETLNYVPKFLAAVTVGRNLKKFGFEIKPEEVWEDYDTVTVPAGLQLASLGTAANVPLDVLKRWNNDFIRGHTPHVKSGAVDIYVPKNFAKQIEDSRAAIEKIKRMRPDRNYASQDRVEQSGLGDGSYQIYVVQKGDTLSAISKRLSLSSRTLMKINGLKRSRIHPGQRLKYTKPI